jgi:hypothetical protein
MKFSAHKANSSGFAAVEGLLVVVMIAAIVGIGAYVVHQKNSTDKTLSSTSNSTPEAKPAAGTANSIDQITQQDAQTETGIDNTADSGIQQDSTAANAATNSVGGAYNENNL